MALPFKSLFHEYKEFIKTPIDKLPDNISKISILISDFQELYLQIRRKIIKLSKNYDEMYIERYEFYKTEYPIELKSNEIKEFIEKDKKMVELKYKIEELKTILESCEKCMKNLDALRWDVRNFIEWKKIENGLI